MAKTGPQRYPGASTAYWWGDKYEGAAMEINAVVWHTTEGTTLPTYGAGASAPTLTAVPDFAAKKLRWYQHFDLEQSARALVDRAGGITTNRNNLAQVELVGTCDPATHRQWTAAGRQHIYWPEAPEWALREVAAFVRWLHQEHGVPMTSTVTWRAYPGSYGQSAPQRLSAEAFNRYTGHLGHQHVPEGNDHGDPGNFDMARVLRYAAGTPEEEPVMAGLSKDDVTRVALRILEYRNPKADEASTKAGRRIPDFYGYVTQTFTTVRGIAADVKKILAILNEKS
ncbi:hypothetical protein ACFVU3_00395 [Streptomyces sp. NPDC058052]|uniref:hypothetical protein n=1 Tax=Streptomyces sp. NPDC058052 TaxID=3346316 RepID=UPI0036E3333D